MALLYFYHVDLRVKLYRFDFRNLFMFLLSVETVKTSPGFIYNGNYNLLFCNVLDRINRNLTIKNCQPLRNVAEQ